MRTTQTALLPTPPDKAGTRTVIDGLTETVKLPSSLTHAQGETPPYIIMVAHAHEVVKIPKRTSTTEMIL